MKRAHHLILIMSTLLLCAQSSTPQPGPSPRPAAKPSEGTALSEHQSNQSQLPVNDSNIANGQPGDDAATRQQKRNYDIPTIVIAIFSVVSGIAAIRIAKFNKQLVQVTRDMVNAAVASAEASKAALHVNRPFLLVTKVQKLLPGSNTAYFTYRNAGNNPADVMEIIASAEIFFRSTDIPPALFVPQVTYTEHNKIRLTSSVIGNEPCDIYINNFEEVVLDREGFDLAAERPTDGRVAIYGRISYRGGPPNEVYLTHFFWWYFSDDIFFIGPPELNQRT